ncbi:MAG TPA: hypothetical protein VLD18_03325, partial [Verrucomicrobiae bacterium]|nr:hypothetical protein [Verrucomicrobiae bacterium]
NQAAQSLTVSGSANPFTLSGGSLDLAAASSIAGPFNQTGGTLTGAGALTISGAFTWSGGTESGAGSTTVSSPLTLMGIVVLDARALNNNGTGSIPGTADLALNNGAVFTNNGMFNVTAGTFSGTGGAFINGATGTFTVDASGNMFVGANVDYNNDGIVNISDLATMTFDGGNGTHNGDFNLMGSGVMDFNAGSHTFNSGVAISGTGLVRNDGADLTTNSSSSISTNFEMNNGTTTFMGGTSVNIGTFTQNGGSIGGTATLRTAAMIWNSGFQGGGGTTALSGNVSITSLASLLDRTLRFESGSTIDLTGTLSAGLNAAVENIGTINMSGAGAVELDNNASFMNSATATFNADNDTGITVLGGAPTFTNAGMFMRGTSAGTFTVEPPFTNTGTVEAASGTLQFMSTYSQTNSSAITRVLGALGAATGMDMSAGALEGMGTVNGNVIVGPGTLRPGTSINAFTVNGSLMLRAGALMNMELGGAGGVPGVDFDRLNVTGTLTLNGNGTLNVLGPFTPSAGQNFPIITYGAVVGDFAAANDNTGSGLNFTATPGASSYLVSFTAAGACDINAVASGDWATTTTWDTNTVPTGAENVCIDADQFAVTVSSGTQAALSLTVTGTANPFTLSGGQLDLAMASSVDGAFMHTGNATLTGAGVLTVNGLYTWAPAFQSFMSGTGMTNANGGLDVGGAGNKFISARMVTNGGAGTWTGTGTLSIGQGGAFTNNGSFDVQVDVPINFNGGGAAVSNAGTFTKSAGAGTTLVNGGVAFNNTGMVNVNSGTLNLAGGGTDTGGTYNVAATGTLQFGGGTHDLDAASSISGAGAGVFSGGTVNHGGTYNLTGSTTVSGGTANFMGTVTSVGASLTVSGGTANFTGSTTTIAGIPLSISNGTANFSSGNLISFTTLDITGGTLTGTDQVDVSGLTTWAPAFQSFMSGTGMTNANGGLMLDGNGSKIVSMRTLTSAGAGTWMGTGALSIG